MDTIIDHASLKLDLKSPYFYRDGDKWVVSESKDVHVLSAIPLNIEDITVEGDPKKRHVLVFNCVIKRKSDNTWGENETARLAQTIDDSVVYKDGRFHRISHLMFRKIAARII